MRIKSLHIYHFGQFHNLQIDQFSPGMNVIFGENEAGKSTIMQFIQSILFGFSTKLQSEKRYEPKDGNTPGGRLTVETKKYGTVTVERIATKAAGEVNIYLENGDRKDETFLSAILNGMEKSFFQGIYCFDLDGLQGIEKINENELGNFLLSAGMTGSKELLELEAFLEKQQADLFKPGGRKPPMNEKLAELQKAEEELLKWERKNEEYEAMATERARLQEMIKEQTFKKAERKEKIAQFEKWANLMPYLKEKRKYEMELYQLGDEPFPENGLSRLEQLKAQLVPLKGEWEFYTNRLNDTKAKEKTLAPSLEILSLEGEITYLNQQAVTFERLQKEESSLKERLKAIEAEQEELVQDVGEEWTGDRLQTLNTSLAAKDELVKLLKEKDFFVQKKKLLDDELNRAREALERSEAQERKLYACLLPKEERDRLEEKVAQFKASEKQLDERNRLEGQVESIERQLQYSAGGDRRNPPMQAILSFLLAIGLSSYFMSQHHYFFGCLVGLLLLIAGGFQWKMNVKKSPLHAILQKEKERLLERIQTLKDTCEECIQRDEAKEIERQLSSDFENRQAYRHIKDRVQEEERRYQSVVSDYDQLEIAEHQNEKKQIEWCDRYGYPGEKEHLFIPGYFEKLEKLKGVLKREEQLQARLAYVQHEIQEMIQKIGRIASKLNLTRLESFVQQISRMQEMLTKEKDKKIIYKQLQAKINDDEERAKEIQMKITQYEKEIQTLLKQANAANEEEFRRKASIAEERRQLRSNLQTLMSQMYAAGYTDKEIEEITNQLADRNKGLHEEIEELQNSLDQLEKELETCAAKQSELSVKMTQLEEGGSYSECLHRFELLKSEFQAMAKKWSVYRLADDLLKKTKEGYQTERLPKIIEKASIYFQKVTSGRYSSMWLANDNGTIIVEDRNGIRFSVSELSRGTAEQLYLTLRLALASLYQEEGLPFIMDDIAVNFDKKRTKEALSLIESVARDHQVLYFTCHEPIVSAAKSANVLEIKSDRTRTLIH
ncbi:ATP-binding protein [Fictibacillus gelatini]|uniref:ATP-binding protein n=1 Tax=Fictibacillus gelatini TaxID=225985 RepID=UPI0004032B5A|nr:AAA family ATPase [Fictibacillus gelatini]